MRSLNEIVQDAAQGVPLGPDEAVPAMLECFRLWGFAMQALQEMAEKEADRMRRNPPRRAPSEHSTVAYWFDLETRRADTAGLLSVGDCHGR